MTFVPCTSSLQNKNIKICFTGKLNISIYVLDYIIKYNSKTVKWLSFNEKFICKKRVFDLSVKTISARFVRIIWLTKFQWENLTIKELFSNNDDVYYC
jgi:hypothetical protein